MKKRILLAGLSIMLCLLGGCLEATPLTDKEMDVVAEYAASLLLKYDEKYNTPLYYEQEDRLTPTPTPDASAGSSVGNNEAEDEKVIFTPDTNNETQVSKQLTDIIAEENITVTCTGYELKKSVQSKEYFSLVAKEGRRYVVVNFLLTNNTGEKVIFDASENGLTYSIDINEKTNSRVSLSMLENDLQYMEIPVPAGGTAEAVLVFEIADVEISTMYLVVENEDNDTVYVELK